LFEPFDEEALFRQKAHESAAVAALLAVQDAEIVRADYQQWKYSPLSAASALTSLPQSATQRLARSLQRHSNAQSSLTVTLSAATSAPALIASATSAHSSSSGSHPQPPNYIAPAQVQEYQQILTIVTPWLRLLPPFQPQYVAALWQVACEQGQLDMVRILLSQHMGWRNWTDPDRRTGLILAVIRGYAGGNLLHVCALS
jgi:hypothetical protein